MIMPRKEKAAADVVSSTTMMIKRHVVLHRCAEEKGSFDGENGKKVEYTRLAVSFGDLDAASDDIFANPQINLLLNPKKDAAAAQIRAVPVGSRGTLTLSVTFQIYRKTSDAGTHTADTIVSITDFVKEE